MRQDIKSLSRQELRDTLKAMGQPAFREKQIFTWLHRGVTSFEEIPNLSKARRQELDERVKRVEKRRAEEKAHRRNVRHGKS